MSIFDDDHAQDVKAQKKQGDRIRREKLNRDAIIKALYTTPEGRDYLWWQLETAGVNRNPYRRDPHDTAFACGELNIGQQLQIAMIEADPHAFADMMKEREDAARSRRQDNERDGDSDDGEPEREAVREQGDGGGDESYD